ncbi:MAG: ATP-binding protein [Desulfosarcinaceae bacterium]|nr:ATP-binding protein [Desulfosarcinaceae bacterium]
MSLKHTVLFVDDEPEVCRALARIIRQEPYTAVFANSGAEALSIMAAQPVHIIVTDLKMPRMDGTHLLEQVTRRFPLTIRLVLSGLDDSGAILEAIRAGQIYRYILKPWDTHELRLTIRQALELYKLQEDKRRLVAQIESHNRQLEETVRHRTEQLLKIRGQAEIGKYASELVHNLNNPLHCAAGALDFAGVLVSQAELDREKLAQSLRISQKSIEDLKKIVGGILLHAREANSYHLEKVDVNAVVRQELEFFEINPLFRDHVRREIDLSTVPLMVLGNRIQVKQILDNIIQNALDAMESCPEKTLTIRSRAIDTTIELEIADTGCGIAPEVLDKVFSPDFTTKPAGKGTGLGMASVHTMVNAYSGEIAIQSQLGQGTRVILSLPAAAQGVRQAA